MVNDSPPLAARSSVVLCLLVVAWLVPGFFGHEPWKPDEGYTIGLVKHVADTGDWVVPTLAGTPFMEKPPIFYLATVGVSKLIPSPFLELHEAMGITAMLFMAVMFLFTYLAGRETGGATRGATALLGLMGCVGLVVRGHSAITDTALWCGFAIACYGMFLAKRRGLTGAFWFGTGAGLAFMSKGFLGPAFLGLAAVVLPLVCPERRNGAYLKMLIWAVLPSLPWLLIWPFALWCRSRELFDAWFWDNNIGRFLGEAWGYSSLADIGSPIDYLKMFPWFTLPLWPPALLVWWRRRREGWGDSALVYSSALLLGGLTVLSLAATRRELYLIPFLIPLALVAAGGEKLPRRLEFLLCRVPIRVVGVGLAGIWAGWVCLRLGAPKSVLTRIFKDGLSGLPAGTGTAAIVAAAVYTLLWIWVFVPRGREAGRDWAWVWAAGVTAIWGTAIFLFMPYIEYTKAYRGVFANMVQHLPKGISRDRLDLYRLGESQSAILDYYFGVRGREVYDAVAHKMTATPDREYLLQQKHRSNPPYDPGVGWECIWTGRRPGDTREEYLLFERKADGKTPTPPRSSAESADAPSD